MVLEGRSKAIPVACGIMVSTMSGSSAKRARERLIFQVFLETVHSYPDSFRNDLFCVDLPDGDPPDVLCVSRAGLIIGVELREWLNEGQIAQRKIFERGEEAIRASLRPEPENIYPHVNWVWLYPRYAAPLPSSNRSVFRSELLSLLGGAEHSWQTLEDFDRVGRFSITDFSVYGSFPTLSRYLEGLDIFWLDARNRRRDSHWLTFRNWGGAYSPNWMVDTLCQGIEDKVKKYLESPPVCQMSEFHLLVYYDQALLYNTPVDSPFQGFDEAAGAAREAMRGRTLPFKEIHLLNATGAPQAWRIF